MISCHYNPALGVQCYFLEKGPEFLIFTGFFEQGVALEAEEELRIGI